MKNTLMTCLALGLLLHSSAQQMQVKKPNFKTFHQDRKAVSPTLEKRSSDLAKQHPEYGILPYNAPCSTCTELLDKRTANSRFFVDPKNVKHHWSQQSYFPVHYKKSENDVWRTIDRRLKPDANNKGVYIAADQPVPAKCDMNRRSSSLYAGDLEFEFNKNLSVYFFDEDKVFTKTEPGNYSVYEIGEDGLEVKNIWSGIDMQQTFSAGLIKTNYVINAPLNLPISKGWMVIEDHFSLPKGYAVVESAGGDHLENGLFRGDYVVTDPSGQVLVNYKRPVYVDAKAFGMPGIYKLIKNGNDYTLQTLVPVEWLTNKDNTYPLFIDPEVYGATSFGNFISSGDTNPTPLAFTTLALGSCDYNMTVVVPSGDTLTNTYVDLEYKLTFNSLGVCGNPPLPPPYCTFSQVSEQVVCNTCSTTSGLLGCNPASPPYTGVCTTDSLLVPGAHSINITSFVPNYTSCITRQCYSPYQIPFTLKNTDSICGDQCGYLCAEGTMWRMTVEGYDTIAPINITVSGDTLYSSVPSGNEWYSQNPFYPIDTLQYYVFSQPATYYVVDSTSAGCFYGSIDLSCFAYFTIWEDPTDSTQYYGYNLSTGTGLSYLWNFGDSSTSTQEFPSHIYSSPGNYTVCLSITGLGSCTSSYCDTTLYFAKQQSASMARLNILNPAGISRINDNLSFSLYPNPASDELIISANNFHPQWVSVYDVDGRKMSSTRYNRRLAISQLSSGSYIIEVTGVEGTARGKFVKL